MPKFLVYLLLLLLIFFNSLIKIVNFGDAGVFYSDSAFRFRYAAMIGRGEKVPIIDKKVHHPEGLRVKSLIHLTEDWVIGKSYLFFKRLFPSLSFPLYLKYFVSIFSSFSLIPLFFLSYTFWQNHFSAFLSALFYTIGVPSFWRVTGNYLREEFALPFLFAAIYFFFSAVMRKKKGFLFLSGGSLTIGLISWHLSQFFFSLLALFFIFLFYLSQDSVKENLFRSFPLFFLPALIVGIFWEPLATKYFLLSFPVLASVWLWLIAFLRWSGRRFLALFIIPLFFFLSRLFPGYFLEYAHVFETVLYKMLYFGRKPLDPSALSFSARAIWMGPFSSPGPLSFTFALLIPYILGIIGFSPFFLNKTLRYRQSLSFTHLLFLSFFFLLFTFLYLLIIRLEVFLFFFVSLAIGGNWLIFAPKKKWVLGILLIGLLLEGYKAINYPRLFSKYYLALAREWRTKPTSYGLDWESLSAWFKGNTKPEEALLADIDISAMLLADTDRPIVIQPIYESESARRRVLECLSGFFLDEADFFSLINRYQVTYVVYEKSFLLDNSSEGVRYLTNNLRVKKSSVAYLMHFWPESLSCFSLVCQTNTFRVYKVLKGEGKAKRNFPYSLYFDPALFLQEKESPYWNDEATSGVEEKVMWAVGKYNQAVAMMGKKEYKRAISFLSEILETFPELERANYYLGECWKRLGEKEKAISYFDRAIENNPEDWQSYIAKARILDEEDKLAEGIGTIISALKIDPNRKEFYSLLGYLYLKRNKRDEGIRSFINLSLLFPDNCWSHLYCGYLYAEGQDLENAEREFLRAKEKDPQEPEVYASLGFLYAQKGEKEKAITFLQTALEKDPNQPEVRRRLKELLGSVSKGKKN